MDAPSRITSPDIKFHGCRNEACLVEVTLSFAPGAATLVVQDHGKGFTLPPEGEQLVGHYGLANMRERANKVAGQIRMTSEPGKGTCIELTVHAGEEQER